MARLTIFYKFSPVVVNNNWGKFRSGLKNGLKWPTAYGYNPYPLISGITQKT